VEAIGFAAAVRFFGAMPAERAERMGRGLGRLFRLVSASRRRIAERNLARAYPALPRSAVRDLARQVFAHFGGLAADLIHTLGEEPQETLRRIEVRGEENARAARATGRGIFFLTAHLGNWELGALTAATLGMPMTVIARPLDNPELEAALRAFRERTGNRVCPKNDAAREILRTLRAGGMIGILADQHAHPPDAAAVPFFGRPAATTTAVARFADRCGALVLPTTMVRTAPARYRLEFRAPIDVGALPPEERSPERLTALLTAVTEELVRATPEQWLWLHNRWRLD
jgi:KDO2-lipid IV(A) lauroyltransferase